MISFGNFPNQEMSAVIVKKVSSIINKQVKYLFYNSCFNVGTFLSYKILNVQQISDASLSMIHILKVVHHHMACLGYKQN